MIGRHDEPAALEDARRSACAGRYDEATAFALVAIAESLTVMSHLIDEHHFGVAELTSAVRGD